MTELRDNMSDWEHDGNLPYILDHLVMCARNWEPKARLIGNARAEDIIKAITELQRKNAEIPNMLKEAHAAGFREGVARFTELYDPNVHVLDAEAVNKGLLDAKETIKKLQAERRIDRKDMMEPFGVSVMAEL